MVRYVEVPDEAHRALTIWFSRDTPDWYIELFKVLIGGLRDPLARFSLASVEFGKCEERGVDLSKVYHSQNMTEWIREKALPYLEGRGLDICCGRWKVKPDAVGVDDGSEFGNRDEIDEVRDACDLKGLEGQDYVFSSHGLEHMPDWEKALLEWARVLKPGGHMFLYVPNGYAYHLWNKDFEPRHKHNFTLEQISGFLRQIGMEIVLCEEDRPHAMLVIAARKL